MNKPRDNDEMPDEIDFSGGVRGKYADRYREGVTVRETAADPVGLYEIQSRVGRALLSTQAFESAFVAYLALVAELSPANAAKETRNAFEFSHSSYFERLFKEWKRNSERRERDV